MLLDALQQSNYNDFNIKLAHTIGLTSAIYCNELLNIIGKAVRKNKIDQDGFVKLDRRYMTSRTTLSLEDQLNIDKALAKINLVTTKQDTTDMLKLDIDLLINLMSCEDVKLVNDISDKTKVKKVGESKKQAVIAALKRSINTGVPQLNDALYSWIDAIYENNKVLSKAGVADFVNVLTSFAGSNLKVALEVVRIATVNSYRDCTWAINVFNKNSYNNLSAVQTKVNQADIAKSSDLSSISY